MDGLIRGANWYCGEINQRLLTIEPIESTEG